VVREWAGSHGAVRAAQLGSRAPTQGHWEAAHYAEQVIGARLEAVRRALVRNPGLPAGFAALVVTLVWSADDGASDPLVWVPGTLLLVGLLVVLAVTAPGSVPGGRAGKIAIASFAAFTGWCFLSMLWADVKADAWSGANKTLCYFAIYALFAIRPWRPRAAAAFLGSYSVGVAAIGVWNLLAIDRGTDPTLSFIAGRFVEPISYANANSALFLGATIPALYLASRRETPIFLRGIFLAAAGVLIELGLMAESRMSLVAAPIVLVAYVAAIPGRLRSLLSLGLAGTAVAASAGSLLAVYTAVFSTGVGAKAIASAIDQAQRVVLLSAVALLFAGIAWGLIDERVVVPARVSRMIGVAAVALALTGGVAAGSTFVAHYGDPVERASIWWDRFKANEYVSEADTPHLTSGFGGAGRYAVWTVALHLFERHPITGIGVDNFGVDWLRERPNTQDNIYPHSVELRTLQQTGLIGTTLLSLFFGAALVAGLRGLRTRSPAARGVSLAAVLVFGYWIVHGSVDWLWEIPALSAAAFSALGLVVALSPERSLVKTDGRPRSRWPLPVACAALTAFAVITLVPGWLAARQVEVALRSAPGTNAVFAGLDRARALNPFTAEPDVLGAVVASQRGDIPRQRSLLQRALDRNPYDWFPYVELGLIEARAGNQKAALASLARARALNPRDLTIHFAVERVRAGRPPSAAEMERMYVESAATCCRS
jgi:hypothetical protein